MATIITLSLGILLGGLLVYLVFMSRKVKSPARGVSDFKQQLGTYLRRAMNSEKRRVIKMAKMQRSSGNHLL